MNPDWCTATWDLPTLESRRPALYAARLANVRRHMEDADVAALLIGDPNDIFYATGAMNMQVFCMRAPARYLLVLRDGPTRLRAIGVERRPVTAANGVC